MRKLLLALLLPLLTSVPLSATVEFTVGSLTYTSDDNSTALVSRCDQNASGELIIPESIEYDGRTYSVAAIGNESFSYCESLTSITIPNSVMTIGDWAFSWCSSLTSVTIPNSVTSIGESAFLGCSSLTSVTIPGSVTSIGSQAFAYGISLTNIEVEPGNPNYCSLDGVLFNSDKSVLVVFPAGKGGEYQIPNSVISIGDAAFAECSVLTSVTIPNSVMTIGDTAFYGCSSLTSVTIPNSVISIGDYIFANCKKLTSVVIPNSVTSIGSQAFADGISLTNIEVEPGNPNYCSLGGVLFNSDKSELVVFPAGKGGEYQIPNSVISIGDDTFANCKKLTSVVIPNSVTSIGYAAFYNCSSLTSVLIPSSVTSIGDDAFYDCSSLTDIQVEPGNPNYCSLDGVLFNSDKSVLVIFPEGRSGEYHIPNSVTKIGNYIFMGCSNLTSVTIPTSVTHIGEGAFYDCCSLTSVAIPNSVTSIGEYAFDGCEKLSSIYLFGKSAEQLPVESVYTFYDNGYNFDNAVYLVGEISTTQTTAEFDVQKVGEVESFDFEYLDATDVTVKEPANQSGRVSLGNLQPGSIVTLKITVHMVDGEAYEYNSEVTTKEDGGLSAIEEVETIESATGFDVYTASGVCVRRNATDLSGLRPGIYIANGRKFIVR